MSFVYWLVKLEDQYLRQIMYDRMRLKNLSCGLMREEEEEEEKVKEVEDNVKGKLLAFRFNLVNVRNE